MPASPDGWNKFPEMVNAEAIPSASGHAPWLRCSIAGWVLLQDRFALGPPEFDTPLHIRVRAPHGYKAGASFRFAIHRRGVPGWSGELAIGPELKTDDPAFDRVYRVESDDPVKCRALLDDAPLRQRLVANPLLSLDLGGLPDPAGAQLSAGLDELRLLALDRENLTPEDLRAFFDLCVEMLNRLRRMGAITQAELSRLPDRYSKPHRRMVIETIDLDPDGRNRLIFDVEAILHETAEDYEVPLPPRLAAFRILRNRPLPYDTIRSVRTIRRRRRWSLRLSLLAVILGSFLLATQWRNPTLLALGVVFVIFFGCVPLFLFLMRPAFLLIAAEKTAIAIPMSVEKRARERIIRLLHEVGSESRISWDL